MGLFAVSTNFLHGKLLIIINNIHPYSVNILLYIMVYSILCIRSNYKQDWKLCNLQVQFLFKLM